MSIVSVILFYSKKVRQSLEMVNIIKKYKIDIALVCIDSESVKELLLNDDKYNICKIPSLLAFFSPGPSKPKKLSKLKFKVIYGQDLMVWFNELLQNIVNPPSQDFPGPEPMVQGYTPIGISDDSVDILAEGTTSLSTGGSGGIPIQGGEAALIRNTPIGGNEFTAGRKEIKASTLSAKEMAEHIAQTREAYDEKLDQFKPATLPR